MKNCFLILLSLFLIVPAVKSQQFTKSYSGTNYTVVRKLKPKPPIYTIPKKLDYRIGYTRLYRYVVMLPQKGQWGSYKTDLTHVNGNQFVAGIALNDKRVFVPFDIGIIRWNLKVDAVRRKDYYFDSNYSGDGGGTRTRYDEYTINYESTHTRLFISTGFGVKLIHPNRLFNIIPMVRVNGSIFLKNRITENNVSEHNFYEGKDLPGGFPDFIHDTTFNYPANEGSIEEKLETIRIGMSLSNLFRFTINKKWLIDLELGFLIDPSSYLTYDDMVGDRKSYFGNITMGYSIPLKNAKKN
jgi:hypothetical protein